MRCHEPGLALRARWNHGCSSDVWFITTSVINDPPVCLAQQGSEVAHRPVRGWIRLVRGDVVAVVAERRRVEREQPHRRRAEVPDVIQPPDESGQVADTIGVAVLIRPHVELVDDGVLVPTRRGGAPSVATLNACGPVSAGAASAPARARAVTEPGSRTGSTRSASTCPG